MTTPSRRPPSQVARHSRLFGIALAAIALVAPLSLNAQTAGAIGGRVLRGSGEPVAGASVTAMPSALSATTAADGSFRLDSMALGRHTLRVTANGFTPGELQVEVRASESAAVEIRLQPLATLSRVDVQTQQATGVLRRAPDVSGTHMFAGAKSETIDVATTNANLAEKTARQIFAKVPGVFVYDMDGTGNQINISTRGLDAHRSWEMNVRQDGVMVNSDIYGYPASHYSPPMEAMERVELVRGTAALQYGAQFGGLVDYVTKRPDTTRALSIESISSAGSFGLRSSFVMAGGRSGRFTYSAYADARRSDGYRANASSRADAQFASVTLQAASQLSFRAEIGRSTYRYQIPGPLTDAMFVSDPRTASRSRNWFSPDIIVPSLRAEWKPGNATTVTAQISKVFGERNSVQFVGFADVADAPNASGERAPRQVDIDNFSSVTGELRIAQRYALGARNATLAAGVSFNDNDLRRRQQGRGTTASDYDLTVTAAGFGRDLHYRTSNVALYAENMVQLTSRWSVIPGFRVESGVTRMTGQLSYYDPANVPTDIEHRFPLFGARTSYTLGGGREVYGGWSQAYRPMLLKDVLPETAIERTDSALADAKGWTLEGGARGTLGKSVSFDASAFLMRYDNRFGSLLRTDENGQPYLFKTNVGSSDTKGVELSVDARIARIGRTTIRANTATAWFDGAYRKGSVVVNGVNQSFVGNRIESVPAWITRSGVTVQRLRARAGVLFSYTGKTFSDPQNTTTPTANGARGLVPAYSVVDLNASLDATAWLRVRTTLGNVFDAHYFTKRPVFYPGPGVWPSDGRNVQFTVELRR